MKIEVTMDDIARGVECDSGKCPVALALRRHGLSHVTVDDDAISWDGLSLSIRTPSTAAEFIQSFDNHDVVSPFTFDLEVSDAQA